MTPLFIDTSALIALHYSQDSSHAKALHILESISQRRCSFYTAVNVLIESLTIISQRVNKHYAVELLDELRSGKYTIVHPSENLISEAETIFRSIRSKNISYSDCISFAVMRMYNIGWVFSFDIHFKKQGFKRIGIDGKLQ
ncbi:PIN domain-containing protein [Candidatus Gottesmanbacteria bacterium]|nr:PIN domain-containing protein [Candidatus Gottesmanbacteria bacterium]